MKIRDSVAFITGANRGIGLAFAQELIAAGAVYAAARNPESITLDGVDRVRLDVTKPETIAAAASKYTDITLLINNAGIPFGLGSLHPTPSKRHGLRWKPTILDRSCSVVHLLRSLAKNGGGSIVNLLSILSWVAVPTAGTYSASKAAAWALTNWLRNSGYTLPKAEQPERERGS